MFCIAQLASVIWQKFTNTCTASQAGVCTVSQAGVYTASQAGVYTVSQAGVCPAGILKVLCSKQTTIYRHSFQLCLKI